MAVGEETCGVISMCNADTVNECFSLNLFGNSSLRHFQHVTEDTCLFLYNYSTKKIHGTWRRTAEPLWNPGSMIYGGQFPAHLPVERVCEYQPVPLAGKAAEVLGCSQTMVFDPFLTRQQVCLPSHSAAVVLLHICLQCWVGSRDHLLLGTSCN
jgi:hypothetical protein